MYLNVGADTLIRGEDIVGIFDLDSSSVGSDTKSMLKKKEKLGCVVRAGYELPKSFVLTVDGKIYLSQFASGVLSDMVKKARWLP
ncbi:MAG: DUF370 domain-containing protein [Clostridia bacterium]|nr:DUF370 domain-containing protein [Clostridia bacterium]